MKQLVTQSFFVAFLLSLLPGVSAGQAPAVSSRQPARNAVAAPRAGAVQVTFTQAITAASAGQLRVYGNQVSGLRPGVVSGGGTTTLSLAPTRPFAPGERVSVSVPATLLGTNGSAATRQVYEFWAAAGGAGKGFFLDTLHTAPANSRDLLLGDLDNDGDLDLVTNAGLFGMFSFLNNGQGRFTPRLNTAVGQVPTGAVLADINQDGNLDLLAGDGYNNSVAVALGDGTGAFGQLSLPQQLLTVGSQPVSVAAGDVDGDGDLDVVAASTAAGIVTVGFNGGATAAIPYTFTRTGTVSVGTQPTTVQLADVDSDGDLDLLTSCAGTNSVSIRLNNGVGGFSGTTSVAVGAAPADLALGDVDGDGDIDLLTCNSGDGTLSIRLNSGTGAFSSTATTLALPPGSTPNALRLGDVDGDGDLDVVVAQGAGGQILTCRNNGSGTFVVQYGALELGTLPTTSLGSVLGDVDGDGDLDVLTVDTQLNQVIVGRSGLAPPVAPPTLNGLTPGAGPVGTSVKLAGTNLSSATAVLFNGTAASFVVNSNQLLTATVPAGASTGPVSVSTVGGTVATTQSFVVTAGPVPPVLLTSTVPAVNAQQASPTASVQATFASPIAIGSAGALRVFGSQRRGAQTGPVSGGNTTTLSLTPTPAFAPGERVQLSLPAALTGTSGGSVAGRVVDFRVASGGTGEGIFSLAGSLSANTSASNVLQAADFDNDGDLDIVSSAPAPQLLELRFNNGTGTFGAAVAGALPAPVQAPSQVAVADVDADGDLDLLLTIPASPVARLDVWLNNGQGRFVAGASLASFSYYSQTSETGDLDADGDLDLILIANNQLYTVLNNGTGLFTLGTPVAVPNTSWVRLTDLDADGDLDILLLKADGNPPTQLISLLNNGVATFASQVSTTLTSQLIYDFNLTDLSGDGRPDAVVLTGSANMAYLTVWPGLGNGLFGPARQPLSWTGVPEALAFGDVNADGRPDAVVTLADGGQARLVTLLGDGHDDLRLPSTQVVSTTADRLDSPVLADFDGDGDLDVAFSNISRNQLGIQFNQGRPAPTLTSLAPTSGPVGSQVLLTGTNLTSTRLVTFGGVAATNVRVLSATQCAAVVPTGAVTGPVQLSTPNGTATSPGIFTVVVPVAVTSRSPARNAPAASVAGPVQVSFGQAVATSAAADLGVRGNLRQGRRTGTVSGAGTAQRTFTPSVPFAPGERVQVTLPVPGGLASGTPQAEVYDFVAATSGPGRANLLWRGYGAADGGLLADFDEDGVVDMLSNEAMNNRVVLRFGDGQGQLGTTRQTVLPYGNVVAILPVDLNGDSHLDLLMSEYAVVSGQSLIRLAWRAGTGTGSFGSPQLLHYLSQPATLLRVGDLNADGRPDLVTNLAQRDSIVVSISQPGGGWARRSGPAIPGGFANDLRLADLNEDGQLDLLAVSQGAAQLFIGLGNGAGDFALQTPWALPSAGKALEVGDVNGDGHADVLAVQGSVEVLLGDGQGGLTRRQSLSMGNSSALHLADLDADGDLDLLVGDAALMGGLRSTLNDGTGLYATPTVLSSRMYFRDAAVADLDQDGSLDMVVTGDSSLTTGGSPRKSGFFVLLNRGIAPTITAYSPTSGGTGTVVTLTGTGFTGATKVTVGGVPVAFTVVSATQITLIINADATTGYILVYTPTGVVSTPAIFTMPPPAISSFTPSSGGLRRLVTLTGSYLGGATVVRFNGVVAPGFRVLSGAEISVLVPAGASTGLLSVTTPSGTATSSTAFVFAPLASGLTPGRNAQHVASTASLSLGFSQPVTAAAASQLLVTGNLRGKRAGTLTGASTSQLTFTPTLGFAPGEMVSVSVLNDLLGMQGALPTKQVYQFRAATGGTGRGTFNPLATRAITGTPTRVRLGDMNGDGYADAVTTVLGPNNNYQYSVAVALNTGNGTFGTPTYYSTYAYYPGLQLGDFDNDGDLDIAAAGSFASIYVWLNDGTGTLGTPQVIGLSAVNSLYFKDFPLEVGDLDGDGDLDLMTGQYSQGTLQQVYNDGTGHFTAASSLQYSTVRCVFMRLADFNLDGYLDLLLVDTPGGAYNQLAVMLNDGTGYFLTSTYQALPVEATGVEVGDLDSDGYLDLVLTEHDANNLIQWGVTVMRGNGTTQFTASPRLLLPGRGISAETLALGDVDADGDLDVLTAGFNYNTGATQANRLFLNNGQGNLQAVTPISVSGAARSLALADVDGDGDLDVAGDDSNSSLVLLRNGPAVPTPLATTAAIPVGVSLHPNPAHGQFTVSLPAGLLLQTGTLTLHNALGQRVYERALPALPAGGQLPMLVPGLAPGLYLLRLTVAGEAPLPLGRVVLE